MKCDDQNSCVKCGDDCKEFKEAEILHKNPTGVIIKKSNSDTGNATLHSLKDLLKD